MSSKDLAFLDFLLIFLVAVQLGCFDGLVSGQQQLLHYDIHHRDSDEVVRVLGGSGLPMKGTAAYYSVMAARDQHRHRRHAFTFQGGDVTTRIDKLGSLQYARIHIGTPPVPFLVALDTGSDLFWLPCRCKDCATSYTIPPNTVMSLSSYEPGSSSTSVVVRCNSSYCFGDSRRSCPLLAPTPCTYDYSYMSPNTATKGFLVEDFMHLEACGEVVSGFLLEDAAINGFLGLGHAVLDLTSLLSSRGLVPNSFSLCFAPDGSGRVAFGDKGDADQMVTPLLEGSHKRLIT
ncbi:unnamed protein product [Cuscuta campestris]|uniref:Peptidase A1 domain-containing protein n=1 Tax=Cuscuta campestris TaxID=132261 RepID=A0A484JZY4_9ASTE|nr:unnamed protein product [Cuscuta campestris]